jgi:hypothetical protein
MLTLHCTHCGYNLTGLPENRCPECGTAFDPASVVADLDSSNQLSVGGALHRALVLPMVPWLIGAPVLMTDSVGGHILAIFGLAAVLVIQLPVGAFIGWRLAKRLAVGRALRERRTIRPQDRRYTARWAVGLSLIQVIMTLGSIVAVWIFAGIGEFIAGV